MFDHFLPSYVTLFVIADPLGTAAIFLAMTRGYTDADIRRIAIKACLIALGLMAIFALLGQTLLHLLSITLPAFRVAGGLLLFVTAFRMVMGNHEHKELNDEDGGVYADRTDIAVFPLAIPLLCGPGCMTASILLFNQPGTWIGKASVLLAMVAVQVTAFMCLRYAPRLQAVIGQTGTSILARVMGVILAAMAIQFVVDGVKALAN